jgi:hypothetical protein
MSSSYSAFIGHAYKLNGNGAWTTRSSRPVQHGVGVIEILDHSFCICLSRIEEFANINTMSKEYRIISSAWLASIEDHTWSRDVVNLDECRREEINQLWFDCIEGQRDLCHEYELLKRDVIFFLPVDYDVNNEDNLDSAAADEKKKRRPRKKITRKKVVIPIVISTASVMVQTCRRSANNETLNRRLVD